MHGQSIYDRYTPAYLPPVQENRTEYWFIFHQDQLLTRLSANGPEIPDHTVMNYLADIPGERHYLGDIDEHGCFCMSLDEMPELPESYTFGNLRSVAGQIEEAVFMLAGRAYHILYWDKLSKFCGRCGSPTRMKDDERAKQCDNCGNIIFPRISPAIIIAIIRDDQILLAHNRHFRGKMYSLIAGFMEPGEEFEDTAAREVCEEVGIKIKNLRYFASQSWPYPDSLMVGFTCEYDGGEIKVDGHEIEHAAWFKRGELPEIPGTASIAGRIIRWFDQNPTFP